MSKNKHLSSATASSYWQGKLNFLVTLYAKNWEDNDRGTRTIVWENLGDVWAHIVPSRARYPVVYEDQKHYRGAVYDMIVRDEPDIYRTDKVRWNGQDLFFLYSPQADAKGRLRIRLFAWEKQA